MRIGNVPTSVLNDTDNILFAEGEAPKKQSYADIKNDILGSETLIQISKTIKGAINQHDTEIGDLTGNGITETSLALAIKNDRASLSEKANKLKNIITVSKSGGDYISIQSAVNASANGDTIIIAPGIYIESVTIPTGKYISLVGTNKESCIIKTTTGSFDTPPLLLQGTGYIANLTLIATHETASGDIGQGNALHIFNADSGYVEVFNCKIVSYQNAGAGVELRQDKKIKFKCCEFYSYTPSGNSMFVNGAFFSHCNTVSGVTNQKLILENCYCYSQFGYAMFIGDANFTAGDGLGNEMQCTFINVVLKSDVYNIEDALNLAIKPTNNKFSGCIDLSTDSCNNNNFKLNTPPTIYYPTLLNGIANFGAGLDEVSYEKKPNGEIRIHGVFKNVPSANLIFNLPIGFRPKKTIIKTGITSQDSSTNTKIVTIFIGSNGDVSTENCLASYTSIDCSF